MELTLHSPYTLVSFTKTTLPLVYVYQITDLFFGKRSVAQTVYTVCTRINYRLVPVTNLNKYLHNV
jgi:hypothetical protein